MLATMAATKPDFLVLFGYYTEAGLLAKQMAEMQIKICLLYTSRCV